KDYFKSVSTDDIALMRVSHEISKAESLRKRLSGGFDSQARSRFGDLSSKVFEHLYAYAPMSMKDIDNLAITLNMSYDEFVSYVRKTVTDACVRSFNDRRSAEELVNRVAQLLGLRKDPELSEIVNKAVERNLSRVVRKLCSSIAPLTSYVILRGDADDVGKVLSGRLTMSLSEYAEILRDYLKKESVVTGPEDVLEDAEKAYEAFVKIAEALKIDGILISPAWHSAASLSLMLSAISDYRSVRELDGLLVYSGGDDILALLPVHSAIRASLDLREGFTSNYFKKVNGVVVTSSLTTGRSFSVRFASLKDLMSEEMARAAELLESLGKSVEWRCGSVTLRKDSLVVSDSRSNVVALLPNYTDATSYVSVDTCESAVRRPAVHDLVLKLFYALYAGILSENFPRDLAEFVDGQAKHLSEDSLKVTVEHVLRRNLMPRLKDLEGKVLEALGRAPYCLRGSVERERREVVAPLEIYVNLLLILRRYV
ncbi:MAG: type III-B CRISPR-associated protein Cas10/Cmr2, partial [Thermofilaceae archaeon]|nr:type III-B CRISPR-associated protein Cas10/Cmr2 [Thermofilaceae archaeon]